MAGMAGMAAGRSDFVFRAGFTLVALSCLAATALQLAAFAQLAVPVGAWYLPLVYFAHPLPSVLRPHLPGLLNTLLLFALAALVLRRIALLLRARAFTMPPSYAGAPRLLPGAGDVPLGQARRPARLRPDAGTGREASKVLAANQGLYNGFLAAGLALGADSWAAAASASRCSSWPACWWPACTARRPPAARSCSCRRCRRRSGWCCCCSPLDARLTEQRNPRSAASTRWTTLEIVDLINAEDRLVAPGGRRRSASRSPAPST
jgi:hypothetical protein